MTPEDIARRAAAKRFNERVKLTANAMNAVAIATVGVTILAPAISSTFTLDARHTVLVLLAAALYSGALAVLGLLRSGD